MTFPSSIHESNVLDGIAEPVAIIRAPQIDNQENVESITFDTGPYLPPLLHFDPVDPVSFTLRNGQLVNRFDKVRARIVFRLPILTATEAVKWRKLWIAHMNGYRVFMRPHNDNSLQLEWQVVPTPGQAFHQGYAFDRYLAHAGELSFSAVYPDSAINIKSSAMRARPVHS